jgi:hypothetical protein
MFQLPEIKVHQVDIEEKISNPQSKDEEDSKSISETRAKYPQTDQSKFEDSNFEDLSKDHHPFPNFEDADKITEAKDAIVQLESEPMIKSEYIFKVPTSSSANSRFEAGWNCFNKNM